MPRISWDDVGERRYETGVDRGVLYIDGVGVPWNGLIAVSEKSSGGDTKEYFQDGEVSGLRSARERYEATIEAFSSPKEFDQCDGVSFVNNGLYVTAQPRKEFGLCYRTFVGNDIRDLGLDYKLHLVYNAMALPSDRAYATLEDSTEPAKLSWDIKALPASINGLGSSAHLIVDSRETPTNILEVLEDILYGSTYAPRVQGFLDDISDPTTWWYYGNAYPLTKINLIGNPSFEGSLSGYTSNGSMSASATEHRSGSYSLAATQGTSVLSVSTGHIPVTAGATYTASAYVKSNVVKPFTIEIEYYDINGTFITPASSTTLNSSTSAWVRNSHTRVAPANAVTAKIEMYLSSVTNPSTTIMYLDDILFERATSASTYFESPIPDPEVQFWTENSNGVGAAVSKNRGWLQDFYAYFSVEGHGTAGFAAMFMDTYTGLGTASDLFAGSVVNPFGVWFDTATSSIKLVNKSGGQNLTTTVATGQSIDFAAEYSLEFTMTKFNELSVHIIRHTGSPLDITVAFPGAIEDTEDKYFAFAAGSTSNFVDPRQIGYINMSLWHSGAVQDTYSRLPTISELMALFNSAG
jgi:hypothetical protein